VLILKDLERPISAFQSSMGQHWEASPFSRCLSESLTQVLTLSITLFSRCYLFLRQAAPGPRPRHSTIFFTCRLRNTLRIMSRLTPGQASSSWVKDNDPGKLLTAASMIWVLTPRGLLIRPNRSSNSRYADLKIKSR